MCGIHIVERRESTVGACYRRCRRGGGSQRFGVDETWSDQFERRGCCLWNCAENGGWATFEVGNG